VLLLAACIGTFVVMGEAADRAAALWPQLPGSLRSDYYNSSAAALESEIRADALAIALSALAGAALSLPLTLLHAFTLRRQLRAWSQALSAAGARLVASAAATTPALHPQQHSAVAAAATGGVPQPSAPLIPPIAFVPYGWWRVVPLAAEDDTAYVQLLTRHRWVACCQRRPSATFRVPDCCGLCSIPAIENPWRLVFRCCVRRPPTHAMLLPMSPPPLSIQLPPQQPAQLLSPQGQPQAMAPGLTGTTPADQPAGGGWQLQQPTQEAPQQQTAFLQPQGQLLQPQQFPPAGQLGPQVLSPSTNAGTGAEAPGAQAAWRDAAPRASVGTAAAQMQPPSDAGAAPPPLSTLQLLQQPQQAPGPASVAALLSPQQLPG
jgi:hypothetical protein